MPVNQEMSSTYSGLSQKYVKIVSNTLLLLHSNRSPCFGPEFQHWKSDYKKMYIFQ